MIRTMGAFSAGFVAGWASRGILGSERELLVRAIGVVVAAKERVTRAAAEQVEWWEDLVAEARARVSTNGGAPADEDMPAKVIRVA